MKEMQSRLEQAEASVQRGSRRVMESLENRVGEAFLCYLN